MEKDFVVNVGETFGKNKKKLFVAIVIIVVLFFLLKGLNPFVIVGAGERGVVLNFGAVQSEVLSEGLHFRVPIMQKIVKMDIRIHKAQTDADSVSKDLQDTKSTIAVNYHLVPDKVNRIF